MRNSDWIKNGVFTVCEKTDTVLCYLCNAITFAQSDVLMAEEIMFALKWIIYDMQKTVVESAMWRYVLTKYAAAAALEQSLGLTESSGICTCFQCLCTYFSVSYNIRPKEK